MKHILPKKRFGQNFLVDSFVIDEIVKSIPRTDTKIVEIGVGLGDLTKELVKIRGVRAFEIDCDLELYVSTVFKEDMLNGSLEVVWQDVLDIIDCGNSFFEGAYDLVANLPYYISVAIILHALEDDNCKSILVTVQKEVADKFCAKEGSSNFGSLSLIGQSLGSCEVVAYIPPSAFNPPPKVYSATLFINKNGKKLCSDFKSMLKVAFKQPKKKVLNNLSKLFDKALLDECLGSLFLEKSIRPHQITLLDYHQIFKILYKRGVYCEKREQFK